VLGDRGQAFDGSVVHLANHDVTLHVVSRAPLTKTAGPTKQRMGWGFPWASFVRERLQTTRLRRDPTPRRSGSQEPPNTTSARWTFGPPEESPHARPSSPLPLETDFATYRREGPGVSRVHASRMGVVYHTYSSYERGVDGIWAMNQWLEPRATPRSQRDPASGGSATTNTDRQVKTMSQPVLTPALAIDPRSRMATSVRRLSTRRSSRSFNANRGRVGGIFEGAPLLLLHHNGCEVPTRIASTPSVTTATGGRYVVYASNGGAPRNPDWYYNLKAHPNVTIEVGTDTIPGAKPARRPRERTRTASFERRSRRASTSLANTRSKPGARFR